MISDLAPCPICHTPMLEVYYSDSKEYGLECESDGLKIGRYQSIEGAKAMLRRLEETYK